jgi:hypothetical protein
MGGGEVVYNNKLTELHMGCLIGGILRKRIIATVSISE